MKRQIYLALMAVMLAGVPLASTAAYSAEKETVYGRELMTEQERAGEQGKEIPAEPGERGKGMRQGSGMGGQGSGQGRGMGGGMGRGH